MGRTRAFTEFRVFASRSLSLLPEGCVRLLHEEMARMRLLTNATAAFPFAIAGLWMRGAYIRVQSLGF